VRAEAVIERMDDILVGHGLIATGESFIHDSERSAQINAHFPEVSAVEMEAAPISQVCHHFGVPFVVTRSISDSANEEASLSFDEFLEIASINSAKMVMEVVRTLAE